MAVAHLPTAAIADIIVLVGFFALARFFLTLAGMDVGTAFGGMGSSREMTDRLAGRTGHADGGLHAGHDRPQHQSVDRRASTGLESGLVLRPSFCSRAGRLILVAVAETGRIPVDNPATHLELTMIHEAMMLEYSGRHLALMEWAAQIKLLLYGVLIANIFLPWGIATEYAPAALVLGSFAIVVKLALLGVVLWHQRDPVSPRCGCSGAGLSQPRLSAVPARYAEPRDPGGGVVRMTLSAADAQRAQRG